MDTRSLTDGSYWQCQCGGPRHCALADISPFTIISASGTAVTCVSGYYLGQKIEFDKHLTTVNTCLSILLTTHKGLSSINLLRIHEH